MTERSCSNCPSVFRLPLLFLAGLLAAPILAQEAPLTIERAVALAVERHERAAIAQASVDAAEARVSRARSVFLPRLDVSGNLRNDYDRGTERTLATAALLTQPLFDARVFPLYRQVRLERDAATLSAAEARRLLGFDAAAVFLRTLSFDHVLIAANHRRDFAQTNLEDVRARFEAGLVSSNDLTRAELELATAERGVAQAAGDLEVSRIDLETLLRTEIEGPLAPPVELLTAAAEAEAHPSVAVAQERRNDIAASRVRIEALRAFADEPAARFYPSVNLSAQTRNINDGPISRRDNDGFVGITFAWPVFDAGIRRAERAERTALVRSAELDLGLALRDVEREMRSASVRLMTEQAALREAAAALRAARKNLEETNALYREGLASALELADATQRLFDSEVAEVTARYRMALAYLALREASGAAPTEEAAN
jgi:outer membrane protein TolC